MFYLSDYLSPPTPLDMERAGSGSFGTNVALIGNRIELQVRLSTYLAFYSCVYCFY